MSREEMIHYIIDSAWLLKEEPFSPESFKDASIEELMEEVKWYHHLWEVLV